MLTERIIGAARLDVATYEAVERDTNATTSALIVVLLAAIASGIGTLSEGGLLGFIGGLIAALIGWVLYAFVAYYVGTLLFKTEQTATTPGELLRTLGFAQAPRLLLVLGWIPILGILISIVVFFWILATSVVAIRQALDFTTGRAIGTAVIAWIVYIIPYAIIVAILT